MKGNEVTRETFNLLKQSPLNFMGNVEGRDVFRGDVDVIVCDGFIGNIALKISEGLVEHIGGMLKKAIKSSLKSQIGYALSKRGVRRFPQPARTIRKWAARRCSAFAGLP